MSTQLVVPGAEEVPVVVTEELQISEEYVSKALVLRESVKLARIENEDQFRAVSTAGLDAAANIKALELYVKPHKDSAYSKWKRICNVVSERLAPFEEVKEKAGKLCGVYQREQETKRHREEQAERERLAKQAELDRAAEAEQLAKEGRVEEGLAVLESEPVVQPVVFTRDVPRVSGVTAPSGKYSAEVTDLKLLLQAVLDGKVPECAIEANMVFLNAQARSLKKLLVYPGVKVKEEFSSQFRPKK